MSDIVRRLRAELPEDAQMCAYWFGFDRTGVGVVDAILSAVARAGRAAHSTEFWNDDEDDGWVVGPEPGMSYVDLIQRAANEAAALVREAAEAIAWDDEFHET